MRPERGPAMNTRAIRDLERPREMRYGEAAECYTMSGHGMSDCSP
jgi:hypothetical protein